MTKEDFNQRLDALNEGLPSECQAKYPTVDEYKTIEKVYTWYPDLNGWFSKDVVVNLYFQMGMIIFYDLEKRAARMMELTRDIDVKRKAVTKLEHERMA